MSLAQTSLNFHESSQANDVARTPLGKVVTWIAASGLMTWHGVPMAVPVVLAMIFIWPQQRRSILSLAAVGMIFDRFFVRQGLEYSASSIGTIVAWQGPGTGVLILTTATVVGLYLVFQLARNLQRLPAPARRHPVILLHVGSAGIFGLAYLFPSLLVIVELVPWLIWRISFLLQFAQRGKIADTKFTDHLFYVWPMLGTHWVTVWEGTGLSLQP